MNLLKIHICVEGGLERGYGEKCKIMPNITNYETGTSKVLQINDSLANYVLPVKNWIFTKETGHAINKFINGR